MSDILDLPGLQAGLPGIQVILLAEVASTNTFALEALRAKTLAPPALVTAQRQTAGRGQHHRSWHSSEGEIALSWVVAGQRDSAPRLAPGLMAIAGGIAVLRALQSHVPDDSWALKWPNDVWLRGRKVAGLLIESIAQDHQWSHVLGVGVNVNGRFPISPREAEWTRRAIHLRDVFGQPLDRTSLVVAIIRALGEYVPRCGIAPESLVAEYQALHALQGAELTLEQRGETWTGTCVGINAEGALLLDVDGTVQAFATGTIAAYHGE